MCLIGFYLQLPQQPQPGPVQLAQQLQPLAGVVSMTTSRCVVVAAQRKAVVRGG
jgi:hypothetical protein